MIVHEYLYALRTAQRFVDTNCGRHAAHVVHEHLAIVCCRVRLLLLLLLCGHGRIAGALAFAQIVAARVKEHVTGCLATRRAVVQVVVRREVELLLLLELGDLFCRARGRVYGHGHVKAGIVDFVGAVFFLKGYQLLETMTPQDLIYQIRTPRLGRHASAVNTKKNLLFL